jgi:hypothetical protein
MFDQIRQDFSEFGAWMNGWLYLRRQSVRMRMAISLADLKQRAFNKQYHIAIMDLRKGERLVSICRSDFERFKRYKWLPKNLKFFNFVHSDAVFYSTPLDRNNKSSFAERKQARERYARYARGRKNTHPSPI